MNSVERQRAKNALDRVRALGECSEKFKNRYRAYVDGIGPAIVMNGLGQALATELAAAGRQPDKADQKAHRALYDSIEQWLCRVDGVYAEGENLLDAIMANDQSKYLRAQSEALAWLEWHKKLCRAEFPKADAGDN